MPKKKKKKKMSAEDLEKRRLRDQQKRSIDSLHLALKMESTDKIIEWLRQHEKAEFFSNLSRDRYNDMLRRFRTSDHRNLSDEVVKVWLDIDELLLALHATSIEPLNEWRKKNGYAFNFLPESEFFSFTKDGFMHTCKSRFLPSSIQQQIISQLDSCREDNDVTRKSQWGLENEKFAIMLKSGLNPALLVCDVKPGPSVMPIAKDFVPLLHRQIVREQLTQVELLLDYGAHLGREDVGQVAVELAIQSRHDDIFELLDRVSGNQYLCVRSDGSTPLMVAASYDFRKIVDKLIKPDPACVNTANHNNETALFFAAKEGHAETAKLLASKMESPFLARKSDGTTPIMIAALYGHVEVLETLLYIAGFHEHKDAQQTDSKNLTALSLSLIHAMMTREQHIRGETGAAKLSKRENVLNCLYALLAFGCDPTITTKTPPEFDATAPKGPASIDTNLLHLLTAAPSEKRNETIKVILEWLEIARTTSLDDKERTERAKKNPIIKYYEKHREILNSITKLPNPANLQEKLFYAPDNVIESIVIPNNDGETLKLFLEHGYDIRHDKITPLYERPKKLLPSLELTGELETGVLNPVFALAITTHSAACASILLSSSYTQRSVKDTPPLLNKKNLLLAWNLSCTYAKNLKFNYSRHKDLIYIAAIILSYDSDKILPECNDYIVNPVEVLNEWASNQKKTESVSPISNRSPKTPPGHQTSSLCGQGEGEGKGASESAEEFLEEWPGVWPAESQTKQSHAKRYLSRLACQSDWQDEHRLLVHVQLQPDPDQALADLHTHCDDASLPKLKSTLLNINTKELCSIQDDENERKTAALDRKKELERYRDTLTRCGTVPTILRGFSDEIESLTLSIEEQELRLAARQKRIDKNHRLQNAVAQVKAYLGDRISTQLTQAIIDNKVKQLYSVLRQDFIYDLRPIKAPLSEILPYLMTSNTQQEIVDMIRKELFADEIRPTLFRLFPLKKTHDETEGGTITLKGTDEIRRGSRKEEVDALRDLLVSTRAHSYLFKPLKKDPTLKRGFPQNRPQGGNEDTWRHIFSFLREKPTMPTCTK